MSSENPHVLIHKDSSFPRMKRKRPNLFRKISLWWEFDGQYILKNFKRGCSNLIKWAPLIWKDRNYDYSFIYTILEQKLRFQSEFIVKRGLHTRAQRDGEIMMTCARLINKIKADDYEMEYFDYYNSQMNFKPLPEDSELFELEMVETSENLDEYFKKHPLAYKKVMSGKYNNVFDNDSKLHIAMNIGRYNHERARTLLFNIMNNHIEGWWD